MPETAKNQKEISSAIESRIEPSYVESHVSHCEASQTRVGRHLVGSTSYSQPGRGCTTWLVCFTDYSSFPVLVDGQSYCSYEEEMAKLDDINKQLNEIKESLLETTSMCHFTPQTDMQLDGYFFNSSFSSAEH